MSTRNETHTLNLEWKPHVDLLGPPEFEHWLLHIGFEASKGIFSLLGEIVKLIAHQNPHLRILLVGGVDLASNLHSILGSLAPQPDRTPKFSTCDFVYLEQRVTDFLPDDYGYLIKFINTVPEEILDRGRKEAKSKLYNLIISECPPADAHSTARHLAHLRNQLDSNGKVLLFSPGSASLRSRSSTAFSDGDEELVEGPPTDDLLSQVRFFPPIIATRGPSGEWLSLSMAAPQNLNRLPKTKMSILETTNKGLGICGMLAHKLELATDGATHQINLLNLAALDSASGIYVCLEDMDNPIMANMSDQTLAALRKMFNHASGILWVSIGNASRHLNFVTRFARTMRLDNPSLRFVTLQFFERTVAEMSWDDIIVNVFMHAFVDGGVKERADLELVEINQLVCVASEVAGQGKYGHDLAKELDMKRLELEPFRQVDGIHDGQPI